MGKMDLVTGAFRPALEEAFKDVFAHLCGREPLVPLAVIAPSRRVADRLKGLALEAVPRGFAGVHFHNLFSFARAIYHEALPSSAGFRLLLEPLVPQRLLAAILRRHFKGERYLSRAALAPGALLAVIDELKSAAVRPDHALKALAFEDLGWEDAPKLAEILALYKRASEELQRRKIHLRADVVRLAADAAPRSALLGSFAHVLYYGFYDLDQNQLDLLREVHRRVPVTLFFPYEESPHHAYSSEFLKTVLAPMAASIRALEAKPARSTVRQVAASGMHDEVWSAAKEVLRLTDGGMPLESIAIVARNLEPYAGLVESVFREHRIPFTSSAKRRLDRDPAIKAARLLFSIGDFDRARVMDLVRSPYFNREGGDPELWDLASRVMGIGHGREAWGERLGAAVGGDYVQNRGERAGEKGFVLPAAEVGLFWKAVSGLLDADPPLSGWKAISKWALMRHRRFLKPDRRVEAAIESLAELEGLAVDDPWGALLDALGELSEPLGGEAGVQVLDAMAARGLSFGALIVLGMNERVFPRFILEDPFIRDSVRSRIEHRLGCRMSPKVKGYDEERLLFSLLMGSADQIVLCHQRSDERGRVQNRSPFLPRGDAVQIPRRPAQRLRATPLGLLTPREASLVTGQAEAVGRAMGWDVSMLVDSGAVLRKIESRGPLTEHDGVVDSVAYWNSVASHGISPTPLERLSECPFRYFAQQMLRLEELNEPEGENMLSPLEVGQLYHDVLERYYRKGGLEEQFEACFAQFEKTRSIRYPVLWQVEKGKIARAVRALVAVDRVDVFKPHDFERELRAEIPIEVGGRKTVTFRGFVDRLDLSATQAFRVIDYKKSRGKYAWIMKTGVFEKGRYLQPPIYFMLALQTLGKVDLQNSRFSYYFLEEALQGEPWELELTGGMWKEYPKFEAHLKRILETIPRGEFAIRPGDHCRSCDFGTVCRKSHLPTRIRAEEWEEQRDAR
jgi:ATP-dependent helicase/nuclease subunit B